MAGSINALPREVKIELLELPELLPVSEMRRIFLNSSTFLYFNWKLWESNGPRSSNSLRAVNSALSRANISARGATLMILPTRRISNSRASKIKSNAWSQGTSFNESVILPCTLSLATMFIPDSVAKICKTVRTSTFWKSREMRLPVNFCLVLFAPMPKEVTFLVGVIWMLWRPFLPVTVCFHVPWLRKVICVSLPTRRTLIVRTGVEKSVTSRLRCAWVGNG